jgi:hypothetical protein
MTPTEMETLLQKLDGRLLRVEQILPTLATKDDLAQLRADVDGLRLTTKELGSDVNGFRVGTKSDLAELRTDVDGVRVSMRSDLAELRANLEGLRLGTKADMAELGANLGLQIQRSANQLRVLIEANRSENQLLAEHVAEILTRLRGDR